MQVITGTARGRRIKAPEGNDVRPTTQKVKEAIFSSIQFEIGGANVIDLYCGCGQLGIEALSRGGHNCVFVDKSKKSIEFTKENLVSTQLENSAKVVLMEVDSFLKSTKESFDIAFLDPPYSKGLAQATLPILAEKMSDAGIIIVEHECDDILPQEINEFKVFKEYHHGRVYVTTYRKG